MSSGTAAAAGLTAVWGGKLWRPSFLPFVRRTCKLCAPVDRPAVTPFRSDGPPLFERRGWNNDVPVIPGIGFNFVQK
jgi:hypothetical protein